MRAITDGRTLRAMAQKGHIIYPIDKPFKYVDCPDEVEFRNRTKGFNFNGKHYKTEYVSGCFYPFVFQVNE